MQIPKNVVQAGDVDPCHKIYIEDYVYTYLSQKVSEFIVQIETLDSLYLSFMKGR